MTSSIATPTAPRYALEPLRRSVSALFTHAGLDVDKAACVANALLDADRMGHATHGLALVPCYLEALASGSMARSGAIEVISDRGACVAWKGALLPGPGSSTRPSIWRWSAWRSMAWSPSPSPARTTRARWPPTCRA